MHSLYIGGIRGPSMIKALPLTTIESMSLAEYREHLSEEILFYKNIPVSDDLLESGIHSNPFWTGWYEYLRVTQWKTDPISETVKWARQFMAGSRSIRILSLGCGYGGNELKIAKQIKKIETGAFIFDAVDINESIMESAKTLSNRSNLGINFIAMDLNAIEIPEGSYDIVFAHSSLHHIVNLDSLLKEVAKGLKKGGVFILQDLIGKQRSLFWKDNCQIFHYLVSTLPVELRFDLVTFEEVIPIQFRDSSACVGLEGVNQEVLLPTVHKYFDVHFEHLFGSLVRLLGNHPILSKMNMNDPIVRNWVSHLYEADLSLISESALRATESFGVYQPK